MSVITQSDLSREAHVSPAAISKAVKTNRLLKNADGEIDTDNPVNAGWIAMHKAGLRGGAPVAPRKAKSRVAAISGLGGDTLRDAAAAMMGQYPRAEEEDDDEADPLKTRQLKADIASKENNAQRLAIGNAQKMEYLVVRDRMRQRIGVLGGEIRTRFLTLPARLASTIHALIFSLLDPETLADKIMAAVDAGGKQAEIASLIRAQLGEINPKKINDLCADEITIALKGAKDAAARADLDSFDPS